MSSVLRSSPRQPSTSFGRVPSISDADLDFLRNAMPQVRMSAEIAAYLHNIIVFMRLHRYIAGGVSAGATRQVRTTVKALAVLHGISYVTPSLVALAVQKVYPHRLVLATVKTERSMQYGSDALAVEGDRLLNGGRRHADVVEASEFHLT